MIVLDTSIIIDHLRQPQGTESLLMKIVRKEGKNALFISVITLQELYEGKSTRNKKKLQYMLSVLAPLSILGYDVAIAELAGKIARDLKNPVGFADMAIAATCVFHGAEFYTLNEKHFRGVEELGFYGSGKI